MIDPKILRHGLIVSCQPVTRGPMDRIDIVVAMAKSAVAGGAAGLRIEGIEHLRAVAGEVKVPIIGIVKRDLPSSPIRITPFLRDVEHIAKAGAQIIAFDGTARRRPVAVKALCDAVHKAGCVAMADCSCVGDALRAAEVGCELIGSTLAGYTEETAGRLTSGPDFQLVADLSQRRLRVVAEGRLRTPAEAAQALSQGAFAVTVGSAITRIEHITKWFLDAMTSATTQTRQRNIG